LQKKGFKEERVTTVGLDDIGTSTTLESTKSLPRKRLVCLRFFLEKKETRKEEVESCLCSYVGGVVARMCVARRCCPGLNEGLTRSHVSFGWEGRS